MTLELKYKNKKLLFFNKRDNSGQNSVTHVR